MATRLTGTAAKGTETRAAVTILSQGQHSIKLRPSTDELRLLLEKVSEGQQPRLQHPTEDRHRGQDPLQAERPDLRPD